MELFLHLRYPFKASCLIKLSVSSSSSASNCLSGKRSAVVVVEKLQASRHSITADSLPILC